MAVFVADEQDLPIDAADLAALARHVLAERRVPADMEVSILLVDEATIAAMNTEHMNERGPTDVLAFPIDEPGESPPGVPAVLGDVVICPLVAQRSATERGVSVDGEVQHLAVHGILHLLGMDHHDPEEEREMFALTDALLESHRRSG